MERVTRIELALSAWEADVLPLNYTRVRSRPRRTDGVRTLAHSTSCQAPGVSTNGGLTVFQAWMRLRRAVVGAYREAEARVRGAAWRVVPLIP